MRLQTFLCGSGFFLYNIAMAKTELREETRKFFELNGFREFTNIQSSVLASRRRKKDLIAVGATGTGKTHAFLFAVSEMIDPAKDETQVIISAPTRELAFQINAAAAMLKEVYPKLRIKLLSGGTDSTRARQGFKNAPHIIIGTPGRIRSFFEEQLFRTDTVRMFIIDEADMTLEYGFLDDIDVVLGRVPREAEILCFSATLPEGLKPFIAKYLSNPEIIQVQGEKTAPQIDHILIDAKHRSYAEALLTILPGFDPYVCLIFANTREECDSAYELLRQNGIRCLELHGGLNPRERSKVMRALKNDEIRYVVASDVASRGIDIEGITHVVSLGFPKELAFYTHRADRTGRNGREGTCFAIFNKTDENAIRTLRKQGIEFRYRSFKNGEWKDLKDPFAGRISKDDQREIEIAKRFTPKKQKVKPNYKKKRRQLVEETKRKERRDFIRSKINEEKKQRYRAAARAKKEEKD